MNQDTLRLIAKTYLLLLSGPADGSGVSPDESPKKKQQVLNNGRPANNSDLNGGNNLRERESEF